ncbi:MAG: transglycosylase domain-containing protein [Clostridiales bacterium]|nr:transglycosylase domain-containing protein [Clostridiales bacterium]
MSENNNGSIHNPTGNNSSQNGIDNRIDYNISASSLTKSLFSEDREPVITEHHRSHEQEPVPHRDENRPRAHRTPADDDDMPNKRLTPRKEREAHTEGAGSNDPAERKTVSASQPSEQAHRRTESHGAAVSQNAAVSAGVSRREPKPKETKPAAKNEKKASPKSKGGKKRVGEMNFFERILWTFKWIIRIVLVVFFGAIFACVGAGLGVYIGIIRNAPALELVSIEPDSYTSFVYDMNGTQVDEFHGEENRIYVTLDEIPLNMQHAFIAIEDERFYTHNGIDLRGIMRAAYSIFSGNEIQGASTITQQLIKNNVTKVMRNDVESKVQEQYLAIKYESMLAEELGSKEAAKDYILELYLNTIYLNHGYNGVQVAAQGYYNKDVSEFDLAECAVIAAITNNPSLYSPRNNPEENKVRQSEILRKMLEQGYITTDEYNQAIDEYVYSYISSSTGSSESTDPFIHTYFIDGLFDQLSGDLQDKYNISEAQANYLIYNGGLQIYSTWDTSIQSILDETFSDDSLFPNASYCLRVTYTVSVEDSETGKQEHSEYNQYVKSTEAADEYVVNKRADVESGLSSTESIIAEKSTYTVEPQAAMVIEDYHTGYVKALIGGRGEKTVSRGFNRATNSARQPGSVFKVLAAFAPGIDTGILTAASPIEDSPFKSADGYSPSNWWGESYRGMANPRLGIQNSMNIIAVKAMDMVGVDTCYDYLMNFGFTTLEDDNHLATALGGLTYGVTQLEVTAAYGTIGNGGVYKKPTLYTKVLDHNGNELLNYDTDFEDREVLSSGAAFVLIDMMKDVITKGTGTQAAFRNISMPLAGKTGTTQNSKDLTFVGITPYYSAGIWLGYDEYDSTVKNMEGLSQSAHMVVWRTCMEKVHQSLEYKDFEMPSDVKQVYVCSYSGMLPNSGCSGHYEYFVEGTEPTENCKGHSARLYLDSKYTTSGYDYSSYYTGTDTASQAETEAPASDQSAAGEVNLNPSDETIQDAYDAEFGDLNTDTGGSTDSGSYEAPAVETPAEAPADTAAEAPAAEAPAEVQQEYYDEPVH